jgi:protein ImuB
MLHTHLENFESAAPIVAVALTAEPAKPTPQQFGLFETALRDPAQLSETLARLTGLLGAERVGTPVLEETYRPDAFRLVPFTWQLPEKEAVDAPMPAFALRRYRSAGAASVLLEGNKPAHLRSAKATGEVVQQAGPFVASGDWWDRDAWARREWDVELENGSVCRCHQHEQGWAVDGIYD